MTKKIKLTIVLLLLVLFLNATLCAKQASGTTDFQFLKLDVGARTLAMGGAFAGVSDDISAIRYNPAGLRQLSKKEASATHMEWIGDLRIEHVAFAMPYSVNKTIGTSIFYMTTKDDLMGRDEYGKPTHNLKFEQVYATIGGATPVDPMTEKLLVGGNVKYVQETLDYSKSTGLALDAGLLWNTHDNMSFGLVVRNLGISDGNYPLEIRFGGSYIRRNLGLSADLYKFRDTDVNYAIGAEYFIKDMFVVRAGYNSSLGSLGELNEDESLSSFSDYSFSGLSLGFGILTKPLSFLNKHSLKFDYAIVDYGRLGFTHIFTLSTEF